MLFNSWIFAVFLVAFVPLYALVRHDIKRRNALLIVASYFFYGWWDPRFLILVAVSTSVDYMAALGAAGMAGRHIARSKAALFLGAVTAASLAFASLRDLWIAAIVAIGMAIVFGATFLIDRAEPTRRRKYWLLLSLVTNLGILGFFKYFNFFARSLTDAVSLFGI